MFIIEHKKPVHDEPFCSGGRGQVPMRRPSSDEEAKF
jgi:hypothetical protein